MNEFMADMARRKEIAMELEMVESQIIISKPVLTDNLWKQYFALRDERKQLDEKNIPWKRRQTNG